MKSVPGGRDLGSTKIGLGRGKQEVTKFKWSKRSILSIVDVDVDVDVTVVVVVVVSVAVDELRRFAIHRLYN